MVIFFSSLDDRTCSFFPPFPSLPLSLAFLLPLCRLACPHLPLSSAPSSLCVRARAKEKMASTMSSPSRPQTNTNASLWGTTKSTKDMFSNRFAPSKGSTPVTIRVQGRENGLKVDPGCTIGDIRERLKLSFEAFTFYMNGREIDHISEAFLIVSSTNSFEILFRDFQDHSAGLS